MARSTTRPANASRRRRCRTARTSSPR
jgi:hypothetical protein